MAIKSKTIFLLFIFSLVLVVSVEAHPPQEFTLDYRAETGELTLNISHTTLDRTEHYIRKYTVHVNEKLHKEDRMTKQSSANKFTKTLSVMAEEGATIKVKVHCSEGGSKEASVKVPIREEERPKEEKILPETADEAQEEQEVTPPKAPIKFKYQR